MPFPTRCPFRLASVLLLISSLFAAAFADDLTSFQQLTQRVLGNKAGAVRAEKLVEGPDTDRFEIESVGGKVVIRGNNANSMAVGLNHYLRYYCKTNVSWYVNNPTQLPETLPAVAAKVAKSARTENRFFLNYCTFGYTMPWWQWRDWERLIDWMALNGVTMPLAITGQEAIWYKVWSDLGLTDDQIRSYFTGPAHLPWHRMANFDYWGGPLPESYLGHQLALQKKIVARERELNMTPVLPAFAGHVPAAITTKFPDAKISKLGFWGGFKDQYRAHFLDPLDPLFQKIQKAFMEEQTRQFGTDHIYGADPFNEITPPSWEPGYLAKVGETIYHSMAAVDPEAQWLQMTWVFYFDRKHWTNERIKAMVRSVPQDKMILLDYYCENQEVWQMTEKFFGQPFIWCYLGNFGGNTMLTGNLAEVEKRIENTFKNGGDKVWGIGSTLEAFDCNHLMYDFLFEKVWSDGPTDVKAWIATYGASRDGDSPAVREAWQALLEKVYVEHAHLGQGTLTNARPWYEGQGEWTTGHGIKYDNKDLLAIWEKLLSDPSPDRDTYRHDVVNLGRQVLGNHFLKLRNEYNLEHRKKDIKRCEELAGQMRGVLADLESLLATRDDFMLGKWIADARAFGRNAAEQDYYEQNARNLLTTWGEDGQSLNDYANRTWSGLISTYYAPRWEAFLSESLAVVHGAPMVDKKTFTNKMKAFEGDWVRTPHALSAKPTGDSIGIAKRLIAKYKDSVLTH